MKISYIITTYNRREELEKHIMMLPGGMEIIVADDGSNDSTFHFCQELLEAGVIHKYANTESYDKATPAKARNYGISEATGDLLIFADDDCLPHPNLVEQYMKNTQRGYCAVGYRSSLPAILEKDIENFDPEKDLEEGRPKLYYQRVKDNNFIWHHFSSGSFAIWREDLGKVRFDEDFIGYGLEDRHFAWLLDRAGIKFDFLYTAIIYHDHAAPNRPRSEKDKELQINKKMFYEKTK